MTFYYIIFFAYCQWCYLRIKLLNYFLILAILMHNVWLCSPPLHFSNKPAIINPVI